MPTHYTWDPSYSVGDEELDRQHQRMFHLVNALPERLEPELIRHLTMFLLKHAAEHFSAEEERMKVISYPGLTDHRVLHDALVVEVGRFLQMRFSDDHAVLAFKTFVHSWMVDHILQHDRSYFLFERELRTQGLNRLVMQQGGGVRPAHPPAVVALSDAELKRL